MSQALIGGAINSTVNHGTGPVKTARPPFACSFCGETFRVDYHGRKPPFCPQVVFMEDVFCMKDPFSAGGGGGENRKCLPTVVGGTCANCGKDVCVQCSLFYAARFCGDCAREHRTHLPLELQRMVDGIGHAARKGTSGVGVGVGGSGGGVSVGGGLGRGSAPVASSVEKMPPPQKR